MPRSDVYASCPHGPAKFHVMGMVPHCEGSSQIDAMLRGGLEKEVRVRLDAPAPIRPLVGTDVDGGDRDALLGQVGDDAGVHPIHILKGDQTPGHSRLVRDKEKEKPFLEPLQRLDGIRIERDLRSLTQVPAIFNQCPIPIQKHSGTESTNLRHSTPNSPTRQLAQLVDSSAQALFYVVTRLVPVAPLPHRAASLRQSLDIPDVAFPTALPHNYGY